MIDPHTAFPHEIFHVAIAQRIAPTPTHGAKDDGGFKAAPFEQGGWLTAGLQ